jgi:Uma2 family endonuclease
MTALQSASLAGPVVYPESDGKPMADNTKQYRWIQTLQGNIAALFHHRDDVFVAGDLLCYPEEGRPEVSIAPDVLVVFGRPKGDRSCYKQWEEGDVPLTVVFEVVSPSNTYVEMDDKLLFYEEHGSEEYYVYDPDHNHLAVYLRQGAILRRVRPAHNFKSPRLGIRFDLSGPEMVVYRPDGDRFLTFEELQAARQREQQERLAAQERAENAEQRAENAEQQVDRLRQRMARLRELSRKARQQQASAEELQELEQLEGNASP